MVITDRIRYLGGIKILLSNSSKFIQLPIEEDKWINNIINLVNKVKYWFKVLTNEEKFSEEEFDSIRSVGTTPRILYGNPKI